MLQCVPIAAFGQIFRAGKPAFTEEAPPWAFTNLFPMSQKPGEGLVSSVLCSELSLQGCSHSRTLRCPLWTSDPQRPTLSKWEWPL